MNTKKKITNKKKMMTKKEIAATKRGKKSLTDMFDEASDILRAIPLRDVADTFDRNAAIKRLFPRTIEDVKAVNSRGKTGTKSTKSVVFDSCITPNEGDPISLYNQSMTPNTINSSINGKVLQHFSENYAWLGWLTCATLAQHPLISRACSIPGEDAVAVGYKINFNIDNDDAVQDDIRVKRLIREAKEMGINHVLRAFDANKRIFGIGICIPCFEGKDRDADDFIMEAMANPYNIDAFKGRKDIKYIGMKVVDPYWLTPQFDEKSGFDPTSKDFYKPTWWQVGSTKKRIHKSWVISFVNTIVADILKPTYYYGGMPLPQMLMERMYSADKVADEAQLLAMSKRLLVVDANVQKLVANPKEAAKIMDALKYARDNWGVFFKNPNSSVQQVDTYITEFNQLIMTQYQLVASIAQIPAPKLLKVMPTGFSDVSELVWKDYAQQETCIQEDEYTPILERHFQLHLAMNHKNQDEFEIVFNPVDVPTLMEKAKIAELEAKATKIMVDYGVLAPEEIRKVLRAKRGGEFSCVKSKPDANARRKEEFILEQAKISAKAAEKTAESGGKPADRVIKNKILQ